MANRKLLLLGNTWKTIGQGMNNVNRSIAMELKDFESVQIYCTVLKHKKNVLTRDDEDDAKNNDVMLLYTESGDVTFSDLDHMTEAFNQDPLAFLPDIEENVEDVTHIVAHCPFTAEAGLKLRQIYLKAKLILIYHVIPEELKWLSEDIPYKIFPPEMFISQAEEADCVFSITRKVFTYFDAIFRNRSQKMINHKPLIPESQEQLFELERKAQASYEPPKILAMTYGSQSYLHDGLDIAACAINKVAKLKAQHCQRPFTLKFVVGVYGETSTSEIEMMVKEYVTDPHVVVEYHQHNKLDQLLTELKSCTLALFPTRCEPFGSPLVHIISAGVPTLVSNNSLFSSDLKKLSFDSSFQVPVSNNVNALRQDATIWRDRIIQTLSDLDAAQEKSNRIRKELRRDEGSKATCDDFKTFVLGGIVLQMQVLSVDLPGEPSDDKLLAEDIGKILFSTIRHCTRLKHHPLSKADDIQYILPDHKHIPVSQIQTNVIDLIESFGRRIVRFDDKKRSLTVFCPTQEAVSDIWAICDVIKRALERTVVADDLFLAALGVKDIKTRVYISGPEFLKYKQSLQE